MRYLFIYTTVTILLLTACGPAVSSETVPTPPIAAPTTNPAQTPPDSPPAGTTPLPPALSGDVDKGEAVMGDAVIVYQRSGGFAGVEEQWAIYADGRIVASDGRQWQVPSEQIEQLLAEIETLGFFEMDGSYMPLDTCCDRFTYVIMVRHHDGTVRTVTTIDLADAPPELWRVIDEMNSLVTTPEREEEVVMGDAVIVYQRSGGFAGVEEQWAIYADGRIVASDGRQWQVPSERIEQLLAEIETLGFFEMDGSYMPLNIACADCFTYVIMVRHHDDTVGTVTAIDASPDAPPELWRVIDEMNSLVTTLERD